MMLTHHQLLPGNTLYIPGDEDDEEEGLLLPSSLDSTTL
jgi:hypothetical protein